MAYDYALVHLKFTIPLAGILTLLAYPFLTRRHWYQTSILITIAVVATIPWDSYLIRHNVWTYPPDAIAGPTLLSIPAEELFFFVIQTYITSLLYLLLNKPLLHAEYLIPPGRVTWERTALYRAIQVSLLGLVLLGVKLVSAGGQGTYMGLILIWATPFALLTWSLGGLFMLALPWTRTLYPIAMTTMYLWAVDEGALRRGTWSIESGTKLGMAVVGSLDVEEAVFFLATNVLIVFGLGAFDNALAVIDAFPDAFDSAPECPGPVALIRALFVPWTKEHEARIVAIQEAVERLCKKSRSFYLASSTFMGRLRIDLVLLYSYCRMADDLVDEPPEGLDASVWIQRLSEHLDLIYKPKKKHAMKPAQREDQLRTYISTSFPASARSALTYLPASLLPSQPLYLLLEGFKTDSKFNKLSYLSSSSSSSSSSSYGTAHQQQRYKAQWPIADEAALGAYGSQVAGTVGELCLSLILHHSRTPIAPGSRRDSIAAAAGRMGIALQYVNIARDIAVDTAMGRVYLPQTWLEEEGLRPENVVALFSPSTPQDRVEKAIRAQEELKIVKIRDEKLLRKAFGIYEEARPVMDLLPEEARRPMIVAVESYMEIGRVLLEQEGKNGKEWSRISPAGENRGRPTRATVPKGRRLRVALKQLLFA